MAKGKEEKIDSCAQVAGRILLKEITKKSDKSEYINILVSPLSFHAVLSMTAAGATGETLNQMLQFLGVRNIDDLNSNFLKMAAVFESNSERDSNCPDLSFVSGIWVSYTHELKDSFKELVNTLYKTEAKSVDFLQKEEVVKEANLWASVASKGLITEVLKKEYLSKYTTVIFANALYFKGTWKEIFDEQQTRNKDFYLLNGDKISVPFMTGCKDFLYGSFEGVQVAKIPYLIGKDKKEFSMYIFLPKEKDGLPNLLTKVNSCPKFFTKKYRLRKEELDAFNIPKFKFSYFVVDEVKETTQEMGLTLPFDDECEEITGIVKTKGPFFINRILQKAFVEVNEKGTEAAAVTYESDDDMGFSLYDIPPPRPRFVADHPFLFMIREDVSRSVLFVGAVLNPLSESND